MTDFTSPKARSAAIGAAAIAGLAFSALAVWVAAAPLETAIRGDGRIESRLHNRPIRHAEGGSLQALLVDEGAVVVRGDPLARLDASRLRSEARQVAVRRANALARAAHARAIIVGADAITAPTPRDLPEASWRRALKSEAALFLTEQEEQAALDRAQVAQRVEAAARLEALTAELTAIATQTRIAEEQHRRLVTLHRRGAVSEAQSDQALAEQARLEALGADRAAAAAEARARLADLESEGERRRLARRRAAAEIMSTALTEAETLAARAEGLAAAIESRTLHAPVDGAVYGLRVFGPGTAIGPGETVMEIAPADRGRLARIAIRPQDAAGARPGARVSLRPVGVGAAADPIPGRVILVSADAVDQGDGPRFLADVALDGPAPPSGAPVHALIFGEARSLWSVLAGPLRARLDHALREP